MSAIAKWLWPSERLRLVVVAGAAALVATLAFGVAAILTGADDYAILARVALLIVAGTLLFYLKWDSGPRGTRALARQMASPDPAARQDAVVSIAWPEKNAQAAEVGTAALIKALYDPDGDVRARAAFRADALMDEPPATRRRVAVRLAQMLGDRNGVAAGFAARGLSSYFEHLDDHAREEVAREAVELLDSPLEHVRMHAADVLGQYAASAADPVRERAERALSKARQDKEVKVRRIALISLAKLAMSGPARPASERTKEEFLALARAVLAGDESGDLAEPWWAARLLSAFPPAFDQPLLARVVDHLSAQTRHGDGEVRELALDSLTGLYDVMGAEARATALGRALAMADDASSEVRSSVVSCLDTLARDAPEAQQRAAMEALVKLSHDAEAETRKMAAFVMGDLCKHVHDETWLIAEPRLKEMVKDKEFQVRLQAYAALDPETNDEAGGAPPNSK